MKKGEMVRLTTVIWEVTSSYTLLKICFQVVKIVMWKVEEDFK